MGKNLTTGSVFRTIVTFALPYLLSYFLQTLYGMADLFIAGQFIGIDGITAVKPKAAFYIFPKMDIKKFNITDDEQFALDLLHQKKILITRGGGFNWGEPDHFRIVYLPRMEVLKESLEDLADFFDHYRQA